MRNLPLRKQGYIEKRLMAEIYKELVVALRKLSLYNEKMYGEYTDDWSFLQCLNGCKKHRELEVGKRIMSLGQVFSMRALRKKENDNFLYV